MQDEAEVTDDDGYVGMVRAIGIFVDLQRPLEVFLCSLQVSHILQDEGEVIDVPGYVGMVRAVGNFIDLQHPLVFFLCPL